MKSHIEFQINFVDIELLKKIWFSSGNFVKMSKYQMRLYKKKVFEVFDLIALYVSSIFFAILI